MLSERKLPQTGSRDVAGRAGADDKPVVGQRCCQNRTDGKYAPRGSLYSPMVISVVGCTMRKPCSRHHWNSSALRLGSRKPGPAKHGAAAISALRSSLVSATAWPKKAICVV